MPQTKTKYKISTQFDALKNKSDMDYYLQSSDPLLVFHLQTELQVIIFIKTDLRCAKKDYIQLTSPEGQKSLIPS